jgi:hypothetical protein
MDPRSIVEKANRWVGRSIALQDSKEPFKIHFLLGEPKRAETREAFRSARHLLEKIPGSKELVNESDLDAFARTVVADIEGHAEGEG